MEDDDPDYEVGEEEREHVRARPARSRHGGSSRSGGYGGHNELSELRDQWVRARTRLAQDIAPLRPGLDLGPSSAEYDTTGHAWVTIHRCLTSVWLFWGMQIMRVYIIGHIVLLTRGSILVTTSRPWYILVTTITCQWQQ